MNKIESLAKDLNWEVVIILVEPIYLGSLVLTDSLWTFNMKMSHYFSVSATQKDTWFRSGGHTITLSVPATENSSLAEKVRNNLKRGRQPLETKTKVIEKGVRVPSVVLWNLTRLHYRLVKDDFVCSVSNSTGSLLSVTKVTVDTVGNARDEKTTSVALWGKLAGKGTQDYAVLL